MDFLSQDAKVYLSAGLFFVLVIVPFCLSISSKVKF